MTTIPPAGTQNNHEVPALNSTKPPANAIGSVGFSLISTEGFDMVFIRCQARGSLDS